MHQKVHPAHRGVPPMITQADIHAKRHRVNQAYASKGFHSPEYHQEFDELHDMNMLFMANKFRQERGLPPDSKTPYCP